MADHKEILWHLIHDDSKLDELAEVITDVYTHGDQTPIDLVLRDALRRVEATDKTSAAALFYDELLKVMERVK